MTYLPFGAIKRVKSWLEYWPKLIDNAKEKKTKDGIYHQQSKIILVKLMIKNRLHLISDVSAMASVWGCSLSRWGLYNANIM